MLSENPGHRIWQAGHKSPAPFAKTHAQASERQAFRTKQNNRKHAHGKTIIKLRLHHQPQSRASHHRQSRFCGWASVLTPCSPAKHAGGRLPSKAPPFNSTNSKTGISKSLARDHEVRVRLRHPPAVNLCALSHPGEGRDVDQGTCHIGAGPSSPAARRPVFAVLKKSSGIDSKQRRRRGQPILTAELTPLAYG